LGYRIIYNNDEKHQKGLFRLADVVRIVALSDSALSGVIVLALYALEPHRIEMFVD
jgi:hypothetical protein